MNVHARILALLVLFILALALGLACETGEEVTREDVEEALQEALGDDVDLEAIEEGVREALDESQDTAPIGASTSLHAAALRADASEVQALLDEGADVNARNEDGQTPLHVAAERGEVAVLEALLDRGADIDLTDGNGATPLLLATFSESPVPVLQLLLDRDATPTAVQKAGSGHFIQRCRSATKPWSNYSLTTAQLPTSVIFLARPLCTTPPSPTPQT